MSPVCQFRLHDVETNLLEHRDSGEVVAEISLAPNPPAEFVVIRIAQREVAADLLTDNSVAVETLEITIVELKKA